MSQDWVDPDVPQLVIDVTAETASALDALVASGYVNKTTAINHSVKLFAELHALMMAGGRILIQEPDSKGWQEMTLRPADPQEST